MDFEAAEALAVSLIQKWPALIEWRVEINPRLSRTLGLCDYLRKVVIVSRSLILLNERPEVTEGVNHEVAHALVGPGHGHDEVWKAAARLVGCRPVRRHEFGRIRVPPGRYTATCPSCNQTFHVYRRIRPDVRRWCKRCGKVRGQLCFGPNPAFNLSLSHDATRPEQT